MEKLTWTNQDGEIFFNNHDVFVPDKYEVGLALSTLLSELDENPKILDLGCGFVWFTKQIFKLKSKAEILGTDSSNHMIENAKQFVNNNRFKTMCSSHEDISKNLSHETFDMIFSSLSIHHLKGDNKKKLYKELISLLNKKRWFLCYDIVNFTSSFQRQFFLNSYDLFIEKTAKIKKDLNAKKIFDETKWNYFKYPEDPVDHPSSLNENLKWLSEVGFKKVHCLHLKCGHAIYAGQR